MTSDLNSRPGVWVHCLIIGAMLLGQSPCLYAADLPQPARKHSSHEWRALKEQEAKALQPARVAVHFWGSGKFALTHEPAPVATGLHPTPGGPPVTGTVPPPGTKPTAPGQVGLAPGQTPSAVSGAPPSHPPLPQRGRIGAVRVEGNQYYSTAFIQDQFAPAIKGSSFNLKSFQRQLLLLNDFPGLNVKAFLKPDPLTGKTDVVLKVKDDSAFSGALEYNNFGNPMVGEHRGGLSLTKGNLTGWGDVFSLRATSAFPSRDSRPYFQAQYSVPLNPEGAKLAFSFANGAFVAGQELTLLDIRGRATVYGLTGTMPLTRALTGASDLSFAYYNKSTTNSIVGLTSSHDEVRELLTNYSSSWTSPGVANFLSVSLTSGLGTLLGGTPNGDPLASRRGAGNSFVKFNGDYGRIMKIGTPFLVLRGSGQWASNPLVIPEQFAAGGPDSVRGYQQAEFLGDAGYSVGAEMRVPLGKVDSDVQGTVFVDHGQVWLLRPLPGERSSISLTGTGVGLRARLWGQTYGRVDLGFPLETAGRPSRNGAVIYGQVTTHF